MASGQQMHRVKPPSMWSSAVSCWDLHPQGINPCRHTASITSSYIWSSSSWQVLPPWVAAHKKAVILGWSPPRYWPLLWAPLLNICDKLWHDVPPSELNVHKHGSVHPKLWSKPQGDRQSHLLGHCYGQSSWTRERGTAKSCKCSIDDWWMWHMCNRI